METVSKKSFATEKQENIPNITITNDETIENNKLQNYPKLIDHCIKMMKKMFQSNNDKEWRMVEENKNFTIYLKYEDNKFLWSRAEVEILNSIEKVHSFS